MIIITNGKLYAKREKLSRGIKYWLRERKLTLNDLAYRISELSNPRRYTRDYIKQVIDCEPVDIGLDFLQSAVMILNPPSGRVLSTEDIQDTLPLDECLNQLEEPAPRQQKLWNFE